MAFVRTAVTLAKPLISTASKWVPSSFPPCCPATSLLTSRLQLDVDGQCREITTGRDCFYRASTDPVQETIDPFRLGIYLGRWVEDTKEGLDQFLAAQGIQPGDRPNRRTFMKISKTNDVWTIERGYAGSSAEVTYNFRLNQMFEHTEPDGSKTECIFFQKAPAELHALQRPVNNPGNLFYTVADVVGDYLLWHTWFQDKVLKLRYKRESLS